MYKISSGLASGLVELPSTTSYWAEWIEDLFRFKHGQLDSTSWGRSFKVPWQRERIQEGEFGLCLQSNCQLCVLYSKLVLEDFFTRATSSSREIVLITANIMKTFFSTILDKKWLHFLWERPVHRSLHFSSWVLFLDKVKLRLESHSFPNLEVCLPMR